MPNFPTPFVPRITRGEFPLVALGTLLGCWLQWAWMASETLADTVQVAAKDGSPKVHAVEGTVLDFTGLQLTLQTPSGRQRKIPSERVRDVQSEWNPQHQAGNRAWQLGDWQQAITHYRAANQAEGRTWVRRQILTRLMRSYQAVGDLATAGKLFLMVAASDPDTPAYQYMPLAWSTAGGVDPKQAESWLVQSEVPPAVLLGASYLLATPARGQALPALTALLETPDQKSQITALASGQIWRDRALEANMDDVRRWARQIETFPEPLRAGPTMVLGVACQRLQRFEQASLYYMRIPILYGDQRQLAARALVAAAGLHKQLGDQAAAITLLKEVVTRYKGTIEQQIAQRQLREWITRKPGK